MKHLDGLLEFCNVVEHGGFTRASEAMGLSTSYISRSVSNLEDRLGVRLLNRSTRRVNLTDLGRQYYERALGILDDIELLEADLADQQKLVKGIIRVTAGGQFGETFVARTLAEFAKEFRDVKIYLDVTSRQVDLIEENFDIAIRHGAGSSQDLISRKLGERRIMVCASREYVEEHGVPETPEDLKNFDCISSGGAEWEFQRDGTPFSVKVPGRMCSNNGAALVEVAKAGLGYARIAENYLCDDLRAGNLVAVLEDFELPPQETFILYPSKEYLPYRLRVVIDYFVRAWRGEGVRV